MTTKSASLFSDRRNALSSTTKVQCLRRLTNHFRFLIHSVISDFRFSSFQIHSGSCRGLFEVRMEGYLRRPARGPLRSTAGPLRLTEDFLRHGDGQLKSTENIAKTLSFQCSHLVCQVSYLLPSQGLPTNISSGRQENILKMTNGGLRRPTDGCSRSTHAFSDR